MAPVPGVLIGLLDFSIVDVYLQNTESLIVITSARTEELYLEPLCQ